VNDCMRSGKIDQTKQTRMRADETKMLCNSTIPSQSAAGVDVSIYTLLSRFITTGLARGELLTAVLKVALRWGDARLIHPVAVSSGRGAEEAPHATHTRKKDTPSTVTPLQSRILVPSTAPPLTLCRRLLLLLPLLPLPCADPLDSHPPTP
jgi:hypothetical protein